MKKSHWLLGLSLAASLSASALADDKAPMQFPTAPAGPSVTFSLPSYTDGYQTIIYPGVGANFNPNPTLTAEENTELGQLDSYCDTKVDGISGRLYQLAKTSTKYGLLEGLGTMLGALIGFGSHIHPAAYLAYGALSALGGGAANADEVWQEMMLDSKGYCMTLMVYKADELEGKLSRITIVPIFAGSGKSPEVGGGTDPYAGKGGGNGGFLPPPHG